MRTVTKKFAIEDHEKTLTRSRSVSRRSRKRRQVDLLDQFKQHLDEIRFFGKIETVAQSASFFLKRYVRPFSERHQRPSKKTPAGCAAFDSIGVVQTIEEAGFSYLIRKLSDDRVDRFVDSMDLDIVVKQTHEMEKTVAGETLTVTPTLVGGPAGRKEEETVTFVTNLAVNDATEKARGRTRRVMRRYARRWGIENSYKSIKDFSCVDNVAEHRCSRVLPRLCRHPIRHVAAG